MTDGMSMALAAQHYSAMPPVPNEPVQAPPQVDPSIAHGESFDSLNYDQPLPPGRGDALKPLMNLASKVSDGLTSAIDGTKVPPDTEAEKNFPELKAVREVFADIREFSLVELQFSLIGKSLQLAESNVRQLYQQQG